MITAENLEDRMALFMLRCTGILLKRETDETRQQLFNDVWNIVKSKGMATIWSYLFLKRFLTLNFKPWFGYKFLIS